MINQVSFRNATGASFQEKLARPQAYTKANTPVAAAELNGKKESKGSTGKKVLGTVIVAGAIATCLALGKGKIGTLKEKVNNENLKKLLGGLETAGKKIAGAFGHAKEFVVSKLQKTNEAA